MTVAKDQLIDGFSGATALAVAAQTPLGIDVHQQLLDNAARKSEAERVRQAIAASVFFILGLDISFFLIKHTFDN